jgi:hypothetical protein
MERAKNHDDYCCFAVAMLRVTTKYKKAILYPNVPSALRPVVYGPEVPVPQPTEILEDASTSSSDSGGDDEEFH